MQDDKIQLCNACRFARYHCMCWVCHANSEISYVTGRYVGKGEVCSEKRTGPTCEQFEEALLEMEA